MTGQPPTPSEAERLATLASYGVLDTPPDTEFDDLVEMAAHSCGAPIAMILLLAADRQWFKATFGWSRTETQLDVSFCAHAIGQSAVFVVPDATLDGRFVDSPLVTGDAGIRFYAGAPLVAPNGHALGALCVLDRQPRQLTDIQAQALTLLSRHAMAQLELRRQSRDMTRTNNALLGILEDERRAEAATRESEELIRGVLNSMLAHIAVLDRSGTIIAVNEAWRRFAHDNAGNRHDIIARTDVGSNYLDVCRASSGDQSEEAAAVYDGLQAVLRGEADSFALEYPCHGNGAKRWFLLTATPLTSRNGGAAVSHLDISARKLAEARITDLNRVHAVLSGINQAIVREQDARTMLTVACHIAVEKGGFLLAWIGLVDATSGHLRIAASAGADADTLQVLNDLIEVDPPAGSIFTHNALRTGSHGVCNDIAHDWRTAAWRDAALERGYRSMASFPLKATDRILGNFNLYAGEPGIFDAEELRLLNELAIDLSFGLGVHEQERRRERAEQDLRVSEERFRQVVENIQEVFWITDPTRQQMLYISPAYEQVWGRTCASLYESPATWHDAIHPDDRARVTRAADTLQVTGEYDETYRIIRPDGLVRWVRDHAFPVRNAAGDVHRIVGVAEDVTVRKNAEQRALRSQRLESIGTLAGGVAHDLNNALAPIMLGVEILKLEYPQESPTLDMFLASAQRGADMVRQLVSFAKGAEGERFEVQPALPVRNLEKLMYGSFPKNIQVVVQCEPDLPTIFGDATQLDQALLNLCVNARDAMPNGGILTLEATRVDVDAAFASAIPEASPGSYVLFRVRDTGSGVAPEIIDRIFDPFFTTKAPNVGTGLGLATVTSIVKGHGGFLHVSSRPGHGSTFAMYLPDNGPRRLAEPLARESQLYRGAGELILFVDDEPAVRSVASAVLRRLNFTVQTATDGLDGLVKLAAHRDEIRAIITDMHMPHMDGLTFVRSLRRMVPDVPIMVASGRLDDAVAADFRTVGVTQRLDKPFTEALLAKALEELLGRQ